MTSLVCHLTYSQSPTKIEGGETKACWTAHFVSDVVNVVEGDGEEEEEWEEESCARLRVFV